MTVRATRGGEPRHDRALSALSLVRRRAAGQGVERCSRPAHQWMVVLVERCVETPAADVDDDAMHDGVKHDDVPGRDGNGDS